MTIENASISRPRLGQTSPTIPARVLELAEQVRAGKISAAAANRRLGAAEKRTPVAKAMRIDSGKAKALAGVKQRLARYEKTKRR